MLLKENIYFKNTKDKGFQLLKASKSIHEFVFFKKVKREMALRNELQSSIIYAKRIQEGMMFKEEHLMKLFAESFIYFKPKDIVSGDFYWFTKINSKIVVAVADCTGHGVPGAFMSVLGISLLNQIVIEEHNTDPSLILQRLNYKINKSFSYSSDLNDSEKYNDGMDIAVCVIDTALQTIVYAGAQRSFYFISDHIMTDYKGSRYPIGGLNLELHRSSDSIKINYKKGDKMYLFTDGFPDQFGGAKDKKFMTTKFKQEILKTSNNSMNMQCLELNQLLEDWKKLTEQTDDILILGIQL